MGAGVRTVGQLLAATALIIVLVQAYRKWRTRKAVRNLAGRVVLITGASSGLGEALVRIFYATGARVIMASRNVQRMQQIKFQLEQGHAYHSNRAAVQYHSPAILELDLTEAHSLADRAQSALELFGHIDILINNAGISSRGSVTETTIKVDRRVMETNFFGPVSLTKALLPAMLEHGCGHIVVISSLQGKIGLPLRSSYSSSKHALHGFFDSLRVELAPRGLHVTTICPGYISTQLSANALRGDGSMHSITDPATASGMAVDAVARHILTAVASRERETVIATIAHRCALYIQMVCPSLLDWVLMKRARID